LRSEMGQHRPNLLGYFTLPMPAVPPLADIRHDRGTRELMSRAAHAGRVELGCAGVVMQHITETARRRKRQLARRASGRRAKRFRSCSPAERSERLERSL